MDILLRKNQGDTNKNNKDVQVLKEELWTRKTMAKVIMLKRYKSLEDSNLLKEIWRNNTREQEVEQKLKKENGLAWKQDGIIYMKGWIYTSNNRNLKKQILQENYDSIDIGHSGQ